MKLCKFMQGVWCLSRAELQCMRKSLFSIITLSRKLLKRGSWETKSWSSTINSPKQSLFSHIIPFQILSAHCKSHTLTKVTCYKWLPKPIHKHSGFIPGPGQVDKGQEYAGTHCVNLSENQQQIIQPRDRAALSIYSWLSIMAQNEWSKQLNYLHDDLSETKKGWSPLLVHDPHDLINIKLLLPWLSLWLV